MPCALTGAHSSGALGCTSAGARYPALSLHWPAGVLWLWCCNRAAQRSARPACAMVGSPERHDRSLRRPRHQALHTQPAARGSEWGATLPQLHHVAARFCLAAAPEEGTHLQSIAASRKGLSGLGGQRQLSRTRTTSTTPSSGGDLARIWATNGSEFVNGFVNGSVARGGHVPADFKRRSGKESDDDASHVVQLAKIGRAGMIGRNDRWQHILARRSHTAEQRQEEVWNKARRGEGTTRAPHQGQRAMNS